MIEKRKPYEEIKTQETGAKVQSVSGKNSNL